MWLDGQVDLMLLGLGSVQFKSHPPRGLTEKPGVHGSFFLSPGIMVLSLQEWLLLQVEQPAKHLHRRGTGHWGADFIIMAFVGCGRFHRPRSELHS